MVKLQGLRPEVCPQLLLQFPHRGLWLPRHPMASVYIQAFPPSYSLNYVMRRIY